MIKINNSYEISFLGPKEEMKYPKLVTSKEIHISNSREKISCIFGGEIPFKSPKLKSSKLKSLKLPCLIKGEKK
jgi:hypothetical protein